MKKKGVVELHFNWIFVLIAGAVIFAFFITIVNKQREFSEIKSSGTIITNLESILTGAQVSTRTVNIIDMPKVDIGFECNRYFIGSVPKQIKSNVVFAPGLLKGKTMITWTTDWNTPYRVTNFLYITDPQLRYIIVFDASTEAVAKKVFDELPKEISKEVVDVADIGDLVDKNNYKVKFVFMVNDVNNVPTADALSELIDMADKDVTAINVDAGTSNVIQSTGEMRFFKKHGNGWMAVNPITYYLKQESLFGAIYAEDIEMYNCAMKKAFKKLGFVSKIYFERSSSLETYYGSPCSTQHDPTHLDSMISYADDQLENFPDTLGDLETMNSIITNIKDQNHNAQLYSCALIY